MSNLKSVLEYGIDRLSKKMVQPSELEAIIKVKEDFIMLKQYIELWEENKKVQE
jgi:hypothetical protein